MLSTIILQAETASSGDQTLVGFLIILLLILPVLLIRALLRDWKPESGSGLFWKVAIIFSSPIYVGVIILKLLEVSGLVTPEFASIFPSLKAPTGNLPDVSAVPEGTVNFWSEFTIGILVSFLVAAIVAVFVYLIFGGEKPSKRAGSVLFWVVMYFSAMLIANSTFDRIQEVSLEGKASRISKVNLNKSRRAVDRQRPSLGIFGSWIFSDDEDSEEETKKTPGLEAIEEFDKFFREQKKKAEQKMGDAAEKAPDSVIASFLKYTNAQVQYLSASDPSACHYFFQTGSYLRGFSSIFLESSKNPRVSNALAEFEREARRPSSSAATPIMEEQAYREMTAKIQDSLRQKVSPEDLNMDVFSNPQRLTSQIERRQGCITYLAFVEELSSLPKDQAMPYYRYLLAERAESLTAEETLRENRILADLYQRLVWDGSPLDMLFNDNPTLKRNFVNFMYEESFVDPAGLEETSRERKQDILDANLKYYYARATDSGIRDHLSAHLGLLMNLEQSDPVECGRWAGVREVFDLKDRSPGVEKNHGNSLAVLMRSAWYNQNPEPRTLSASDMKDFMEDIQEAAEGKVGRSISLSNLYNPARVSNAGDKRRLCDDAIAFYQTLLDYPASDIAAFYRTFMAEGS